MTGLLGLLIGVAVNFRLPNLFLSSGYFLFFFFSFLKARSLATLLQGALFGVAFAAGVAPTLLANAINAGSPFRTTYGSADVMPPDLDFSIIWQYVTDMQFLLLALAGAWTVWVLRSRLSDATGRVALVTAGNLLANLSFFMSHPVFTPYYTIPVAMLSLWSLLFAFLLRSAGAADRGVAGQAAKARPWHGILSRQA